MVCNHLAPLEKALLNHGLPVTYRGQPWSRNCREWVYFEVILDVDLVRKMFSLPECVMVHENTDGRSGLERGFACSVCKDGIMGALRGEYPRFPRYREDPEDRESRGDRVHSSDEAPRGQTVG